MSEKPTYEELEQRIRELEQAGSEHKRAEEALRKSDEHLSATLRSIGDGVISCNTDGTVASLNAVAEKLTGWTAVEAERQPIDEVFNIVNAQTREKAENPVKRSLKEGTVVGLANHTLLIGKNGNEYQIADSCAPVKGKDGEIMGCVLVFRDVTGEYEQREALRKNEELLKGVFNSVQDGMSVVDKDLNILKVNRIMNKWYESNTPLKGKKCYECYQNADNPCDPCPTLRCMKTGQVEREIVKGLSGSSIQWIELYSYPMWDDQNEKITGAVEFVRDITSRKRADEALRKSEERFRILSNDLPALICEFLPDTTLTFVNNAYCEFFGMSAEKLIGCSFLDLIPEQAREDTKKQFSSLTMQKPVKACTHEVIKNGKIAWQEWRDRAIFDEQGQIIKYHSIGIDITERKRAEEALRQSEEKFRALVETTSDWIWEVDSNGIYIYASPQVESLLGHTPEEVIGKTPFDFMPPEEARRVGEIFATIVEECKPFYNLENINLHKDGRQLVLETSGVSIFDDKGNLTGFRGVDRDITERKRSEEEVRREKERVEQYLNIAGVMLGTINADEKITMMNKRGCEILGCKEGEFIGKNWFDLLVPQELRDELRGVFCKLMDGDIEPVEFYENPLITKDGEEKLLAFHNTFIKDPNGQITGVLFSAEDITERKRAEEERAKLHAQLNHARKMESIGTLAGGIAHNFNNILMGVQGRTSLMMMNKDTSDPDYEHLKGIEEYVRNAVELTRDLLGFARGGKYEVKPTDLNTLIKPENRMFGNTRKEIRVQGRYEKDLWTVEVDPGQIRQALLNLYVNAWQAMTDGGDLYIQTENVTLDKEYIKPFAVVPGRYVKVSVTDTGVGMDAATREKIFDPFFSTRDIGQGSGMGLASVYGIIKNHGGFINVYSEKGVGTTFNIYLPESEKETMEEAPRPDRHEIQYGQGTVLLVDDEEMIIEVGQAMLESLGYRVFTAGSGREALALYEKQKGEIDLVILDMIMPGMGGGETFDRMKKIGGDARVLLSSGYSINGQAKEIMDRGCIGFIQKPFSMEEVSIKVSEALDGDKE